MGSLPLGVVGLRPTTPLFFSRFLHAFLGLNKLDVLQPFSQAGDHGLRRISEKFGSLPEGSG